MIACGAELAQALAEGPAAAGDLAALPGAVTSAAAGLEASFAGGVQDGQLRSTLDGMLALAAAPLVLLATAVPDPAAAADELDHAAGLLMGAPSAHASGAQRDWIARAWQVAALLFRYDAAIRSVSGEAPGFLQAAKRQAQVLHADVNSAKAGTVVPSGLGEFFTKVEEIGDPDSAQAAWQQLAGTPPVSLVGTSLLPERFFPGRAAPVQDEPPQGHDQDKIRPGPYAGAHSIADRSPRRPPPR
jgi:hypothetical protein